MTLIRALVLLRLAVDWLQLPPIEGCTSGLCRAACRLYAGTIPRLRLQGTMERQEKYRSEASLLASGLQPLASSFGRRLRHLCPSGVIGDW